MIKNPRDIIIAPVVSEKSYDLIEKTNTYTFEVDRRSNKSEIRDAIQDIFAVAVVSVNTQNRIGKMKRTGRVVGRRNHVKRALVTLASGDSIDLFGI